MIIWSSSHRSLCYNLHICWASLMFITHVSGIPAEEMPGSLTKSRDRMVLQVADRNETLGGRSNMTQCFSVQNSSQLSLFTICSLSPDNSFLFFELLLVVCASFKCSFDSVYTLMRSVEFSSQAFSCAWDIDRGLRDPVTIDQPLDIPHNPDQQWRRDLYLPCWRWVYQSLIPAVSLLQL